MFHKRQEVEDLESIANGSKTSGCMNYGVLRSFCFPLAAAAASAAPAETFGQESSSSLEVVEAGKRACSSSWHV